MRGRNRGAKPYFISGGTWWLGCGRRGCRGGELCANARTQTGPGWAVVGSRTRDRGWLGRGWGDGGRDAGGLAARDESGPDLSTARLADGGWGQAPEGWVAVRVQSE